MEPIAKTSMLKISANRTYYNLKEMRWLFRLGSFCFLCLMLLLFFITEGIDWAVFFAMVLTFIAGNVIYEARIPSGTVDEVFDAGDHLVIKHKKEEKKVYVTQILNYSYNPKDRSPLFSFFYKDENQKLCSFTFICNFIWYKEDPQILSLIKRIEEGKEIKDRHA